MQKRAKVRRAVYAEGTQKSLHTDENKTEIYYERIEEKINYSCKRIDLESDRQSGHKSLRFEREYTVNAKITARECRRRQLEGTFWS